MAASLEVRSPLLDHRLAEWAATVSTSYKLRNGQGKYILTRALGHRLAPGLLNRKKMGFAMPLAEWLNGPLRELVRDTLESPAFLDRGIVSPFLSVTCWTSMRPAAATTAAGSGRCWCSRSGCGK